MIKKIDHFVITTSQLSHCLIFYEKLGFTVQETCSRYELYAGDFKINVHIKGRELLPHASNIQSGCADLCFEISGSFDEFQKKLVSEGLEIELGIVERKGVKGAMHSIYLRDPDGNLLEFCSYQ